MAEDIKRVLRNAGYAKLKQMITYNSHVEDALNMGEEGGEILIPDEVNSAIKAKPTKHEKTEYLLNHIRHSFDLEWLEKFAEVLVGDPGDKQNKKAGKMILDALSPVGTRPIPQEPSSTSQIVDRTRSVPAIASVTAREVEFFLNSSDVTESFNYCSVLSSEMIAELKTSGIVTHEEQEQLSSSGMAQLGGGRIILRALLRDPCQRKLEDFGRILSRDEAHINNQELAGKIGAFLREQPIQGLATQCMRGPQSSPQSAQMRQRSQSASYSQQQGVYGQPLVGNGQHAWPYSQHSGVYGPAGGHYRQPGVYDQQAQVYSPQSGLQPGVCGQHAGQYSQHPAGYMQQGGVHIPGSQHEMYDRYQSPPGPRNRDPVPLQPTSQHGHDSYVLEQGAQLPRDTEESHNLKSPTQASDDPQNHPSQQSGHHSLVAASPLPRVHQGEFTHPPPPVPHQGDVGGLTHPPQPQQNPTDCSERPLSSQSELSEEQICQASSISQPGEETGQ